jgi:hypothetical protein
MNRTLRMLMVPAVATVVGTTGFAFMASNTVPVTHAGEGRADISGYEVSDVTYGYGHRGGQNPTPGNNGAGAIRSVSFTLNHPATNVTAFVEQGDPTTAVEFRNCVPVDSSPGRFTCTGGEAFVWKATGLFVSAAQ